MTDCLRWSGSPGPEGGKIIVRAPAKLNLTLAVYGKRPDGYHDIRSLVVGLDWYDVLHIEVGQNEGIELQCKDSSIPSDSRNLVWRAAELLAERLKRSADVSIRLDKQVPPGSGLGGGSSDAAATLFVLNQLWRAGLDRRSLMQVGAEVGSDVPLFFNLPAAIISGRGEQVEPVSAGHPFEVLLVLPAVHVSTAHVYGNHFAQPRGKVRKENGWESLLDQEAESLSKVLFNDLEEATFRTSSPLRTLFDEIVGLGLEQLRLTGSGSAMFALFSPLADAKRWADRIHTRLGVRTWVTRTLTTNDFESGNI